MTEPREPREWWLKLNNGGIADGYTCPILAARAAEAFSSAAENAAEVVHVREVLPEEAACSCGTPLDECYPSEDMNMLEDDDSQGPVELPR